MVSEFPHTEDVKTVTFSPDGKLLLSGSYDNTAKLWDVATGRLIKAMKHGGPVLALAFAPNGELFATSGFDGAVNVWNMKTLKRLPWQFRHQGVVRYLRFTPDSGRLVSGGDDRTVRVWDVEADAHNTARLSHSDRVWDVAFNSDGSMLASAGVDGLRLWLKGEDAWMARELNDRQAVSVAFSPKRNLLACGIQGKANDQVFERIELWNLGVKESSPVCFDSNREGAKDVANNVRDLAFSPDGKSLVVFGNDEFVELWDVDRRKCRWKEGVKKCRPLQGTFRRDGSEIASGWSDRWVRVFRASDGKIIRSTLIGSQIEGVIYNSTGSMLIVSCRDRTVRFLNAETHQSSRPPLRLDAILRSISVDPTARILAATLSDGSARLWDIETGLQCGPKLDILRVGTGLNFSPDGKSLTAASFSNDVFVWQLPWNTSAAMSSEQMKLATSVAIGARLSTVEQTGDTGTVEPIAWREWQELRRQLTGNASK